MIGAHAQVTVTANYIHCIQVSLCRRRQCRYLDELVSPRADFQCKFLEVEYLHVQLSFQTRFCLMPKHLTYPIILFGLCRMNLNKLICCLWRVVTPRLESLVIVHFDIFALDCSGDFTRDLESLTGLSHLFYPPLSSSSILLLPRLTSAAPRAINSDRASESTRCLIWSSSLRVRGLLVAH